MTLCVHDMPGSATGRMRVGPSVYVRFHGASGRYDGSYPDDRLAGWADWLHGERRRGADVFAYFNNDVGGHAPRNALMLRRHLERAAGELPCGGHRMTSDQKFLAGLAAGVAAVMFAGRASRAAGTPSISAGGSS